MGKDRTALVVEDEAVVRFDITEHLIEHGYRVLEAGNSAEAFELLESETDVAFVVTDIDMPGIVDGLSLAKFAAEKWPHVRIIVISGQRSAEATDLPDGSVFIAKPYDLAELSAVMDGWMKDDPAMLDLSR